MGLLALGRDALVLLRQAVEELLLVQRVHQVLLQGLLDLVHHEVHDDLGRQVLQVAHHDPEVRGHEQPGHVHLQLLLMLLQLLLLLL